MSTTEDGILHYGIDNIGREIKYFHEKDSNIVLYWSNKLLYFRAQVKKFQNHISIIDNYANFVKSWRLV